MAPAGGSWWRVDAEHPDQWDWTGFPFPRHRFDPASGRFRVRYAANRPAVAARERFTTRALTHADGELWLVQLERMPSGLHLTHQVNLDTLGLDDRVNTGRVGVRRGADPDPLLGVCGELADAIYDWWDHHPPPLVYRARTIPAGRNIAFTSTAASRAVRVGRLRDAPALHAHLVLRSGFTVPSTWFR
ncbi:MAG: RES domain-containing protein [Acidimicrobiia bacterium]